MQNTIHFVLQGKGGIGKSFVSCLLAQYFQNQNANLKCFDLDQVNSTLSYYKALNVEHYDVLDEDETVVPKKFDGLMEELFTKEGTFVIDTGANTFSNLLSYLIQNDIFSLLRDYGKKVYIHTIVGGGDALLDTANGFNSIALGADANLVLWLNQHFGKLETEDGKEFIDAKVFKAHKDKLCGIVVLSSRQKDKYGDDVVKMNTKRLTLTEVMDSSDFMIAEKQRIKTVVNDVFNQLSKIEW